MAIVSTTVHEVQAGPNKRLLYYVCTDDGGTTHNYGPVITSDPAFDANAFRATVAAKVAASLADGEAAQLIG